MRLASELAPYLRHDVGTAEEHLRSIHGAPNDIGACAQVAGRFDDD